MLKYLLFTSIYYSWFHELIFLMHSKSCPVFKAQSIQKILELLLNSQISSFPDFLPTAYLNWCMLKSRPSKLSTYSSVRINACKSECILLTQCETEDSTEEWVLEDFPQFFIRILNKSSPCHVTERQ